MHLYVQHHQSSSINAMAYQEFAPCDFLKPYVKCYYLYESDTNAVFEDKALATGCMEIMFNLGNGRWQTVTDGISTTTPMIEVWGQVIEPLTFRSLGKNIMFGMRFYPHTASIFLQQDVSEFNNQVSDYTIVADPSVQVLHARLQDAVNISQRVELVEEYLLKKLVRYEKKLPHVALIGNVMKEMQQRDFFDNISNVADRYGITSRYLQKLFVQHTGLSPKLYSKINRFQNSLLLVGQQQMSLTSIAYEAGYFDQSHFIREFKLFAGTSPSVFDTENTSALLASPNK